MCRDESTEEPRSGKRPIKVEVPDTTNTANVTNAVNTANLTNTVNAANGINGTITSNLANTPRRKRVKVEADACDATVTIPSVSIFFNFHMYYGKQGRF